MAKTIDELVIEIRAETSGLRRGLDGVNKKLDQSSKAAKRTGLNFRNFAKIIGVIGLGKLVAGVVRTTRTFEDLKATIQANTGSITETNKAFADILQFTKTTTFTIEQVTKAFIEFRRLGLSMTREQMKGIGNVAAANNKSIDEMAQAIFRASTTSIEQLMGMGFTGQMAGDMITLRFGEKGVAGTIEKTMKKNTENVLNFVKEVGDAKFGTALEDRLKTLSGAVVNLEDKVSIFQNAIGEAGLKTALIELATTFQSIATDASGEGGLADLLGRIMASAVGFLNSALQTMDENAGKVILTLKILTGIIAVQVGRAILGAMIAGWGSFAAFIKKTLIPALVTLRNLMTTITVAALANPWTALATAAILGISGTAIALNWDTITAKFKEIGEGLGEAIEDAFAPIPPPPPPDPDGKGPAWTPPDYSGNAGIKSLTDLKALFKEGKFEAKDLARAQELINEALRNGNVRLEEANALWREALNQAGPMGKAMAQIGDEIDNLASGFSDNLVDALMAGENALESFKNFALDVVQAVISAFMELLVIQPIVDAILGAFGVSASRGGVGGNPSSASSGGGGPSAHGGSMQAGTPYLVGERGAELFIPHSGGTLMNNMNTKNSMGGQNIVVNQSLNFSTGVVPTVRTEITKMLPQIAELTKASVFEAATRGGQFRKALQGGVG